MIGLGSNRLSVCRRGGMSVTQAGRGGMEWLAGGRGPSWASPYSAQATAALLAQFPTQWPTIRDYGFAHPALVPFINEDPMLVMSLIEGLGTRWLVGDGNCYIPTAIGELSTTVTETIKSLFMCTDAMTSEKAAFGIPYPQIRLTYGWYNSKMGLLNTGGNPQGNIPVTPNVEIKAEVNWIGSSATLYINDTNKGTWSIANLSGITNDFYIFSRNSGTGMTGKMSYLERWHGDIQVKNFVPFVSTTRNGMLDIHDLEHPTFHTNQGTGTFTTEEVIAS